MRCKEENSALCSYNTHKIKEHMIKPKINKKISSLMDEIKLLVSFYMSKVLYNDSTLISPSHILHTPSLH